MATNEPKTAADQPPMPREELLAIRERVSNATPFPWEAWHPTRSDTTDLASVRVGEEAYWTPGTFDYEPGTLDRRRELAGYDAELIAHAPYDLASLLAEVGRLRAKYEPERP